MRDDPLETYVGTTTAVAPESVEEGIPCQGSHGNECYAVLEDRYDRHIETPPRPAAYKGIFYCTRCGDTLTYLMCNRCVEFATDESPDGILWCLECDTHTSKQSFFPLR